MSGANRPYKEPTAVVYTDDRRWFQIGLVAAIW